MDFAFSTKVEGYRKRLQAFMGEHIYPRVSDWQDEVEQGKFPVSFMEELKARAKSENLWNLFLPGLLPHEPGTGLSTLEYAPLAEIMGRVPWASEVFNCNAPDTGNMELLHMFASAEQGKRWLAPLLNGEIRSAFAMTEPDVSCSDATNVDTRIRRDGEDLVINGRKWFITNAAHPDCKLFIVMGKTSPEAHRHRQQSMVLVPADAPGLHVGRNIKIMNHISPEGHNEVKFDNVRVPASAFLGNEGDGFMMAQARLGPGRIHHCMRSIGLAELALDLLIRRARERKTFGKYLYQHGAVSDWIARSRLEIDQARLLVLKTAWMIDNLGAKAARKEISMIKAIVPTVHAAVADRAMQAFGAAGLSQDTPLANIWTLGRALRYADGPDEVHLRAVARAELTDHEARQDNGFRTPG